MKRYLLSLPNFLLTTCRHHFVNVELKVNRVLIWWKPR